MYNNIICIVGGLGTWSGPWFEACSSSRWQCSVVGNMSCRRHRYDVVLLARHNSCTHVTWRVGRTDERLAQMLHGQLSHLYCTGGRRAETRARDDDTSIPYARAAFTGPLLRGTRSAPTGCIGQHTLSSFYRRRWLILFYIN